jgi:protein-disulfide isomerase
MSNTLLRLTASLVLIFTATTAIAQDAANNEQKPAEPFVYAPTTEDITTGVPDAPVTLVEYASLSCPHCAHFHNEVLAELRKKYIEPGKLRLVYRHFPLNAPALSAAVTVNCVEPNERAKYLKVLFATQDKWAFDTKFQDAISGIVSVGGLTTERLSACRLDKSLEERILKIRQEAAQKGWVESTPTFFLNGIKYVGDRNVEEFSKAIDSLLTKK